MNSGFYRWNLNPEVGLQVHRLGAQLPCAGAIYRNIPQTKNARHRAETWTAGGGVQA